MLNLQIVVTAAANNAPVMEVIGDRSVNESEYLKITLNASDNDGDELTYFSNASFGDLADSVFSWTPDSSHIGNHTVNFTVSDGHVNDSEIIIITVIDPIIPNNSLVLDPIGDRTVNESEPLNITLSASDDDGDLNYSKNVSFGNLTGNVFTWTPDSSDVGIHTVNFTVSDGNTNASETITITVLELTISNNALVLDPIGDRVVNEFENLKITLSASGGDGDLNYSKNVSFGALIGNVFTWTPGSGDVGTHTVNFTVSDGNTSASETVSIIVKKPSPSSSGGSGGGSMNAGEDFENIDLKDYKIKYVNKDMESLFEFAEPANSIMSVSFVSKLNGGQIKAVVEMLKETSTLVNSAPVGEVYKNMNIWVGDSKFSSAMIYNVVIKFKVERSWVISNDYDSDLVKLSRYSDGMWNSLETSKIGEDEDYFYYEAMSPGFSQFAIIIPDDSKIVMIEDSSLSNEDTKMSIGDDITPDEDKNASQDSKRSLLLLLLVGSIVAVAAVGIKYRSHYEKFYMQIANPDGKRYRRIKK